MLICPNFANLNVIVLGDVMLDRYWHGDTSRISPEAPVPVVKIEQNEERVGGAANVAVNLQVLGATTTLISVIGEDEPGRVLTQMLRQKSVKCEFVKSQEMRTTLKLRVLGRHQQLIRLDFEDKYQGSPDKLLAHLIPLLKQSNVLILSDYAKGVLADPQPFIRLAHQMGVKIIVDPKNADLSVYRGASVLTPNLGEFEAAVGVCETQAQLENKGLKLVSELGLEGLLITRGSEGMTLIQVNKPPVHIKAKAQEVFDITGAGDTVIAVLGASLAAGTSLEDAAELANFAAGIAVGKLGTATISPEELQAAVANQYPSAIREGIVPLIDLIPKIQDRKQRGHRIVVTNGCFDILHAGHVNYLQQARALGDCLVGAVNDDKSVRRLKGESRPINTLAQRMQVLAALGCVDYVVPFSEDTPENLIIQLSPHILVKGGDYTPEQIAGAKHVLAQGGSVEILQFVEGCSTTGMLKRANDLQSQIQILEAVS